MSESESAQPTTVASDQESGSRSAESNGLSEAMERVERGLAELTHHLEDQFNDSQADASHVSLDSFRKRGSGSNVDESADVDDTGPDLQSESIIQQEDDEDDEDDEDHSLDSPEDLSPSHSSQEVFSNKLFNLISSLQSREETTVDEWENDDDAGYVTVTLSEAEFYDYEDVRTYFPFC